MSDQLVFHHADSLEIRLINEAGASGKLQAIAKLAEYHNRSKHNAASARPACRGPILGRQQHADGDCRIPHSLGHPRIALGELPGQAVHGLSQFIGTLPKDELAVVADSSW